ncbi:MAG: hypothetical protein IJR68_02985 [Fretibacterium sp.]|nr:hypothetical protein [Fretibacterium sp.]
MALSAIGTCAIRNNMFAYFLTRPISLVLLALVILSMFSPILMNYVNKKSRGETKSA